MTATIELTSKSGTKRTYNVTGVDRETLQSVTTGSILEESDGSLRVCTNNKRDAADLEALVAKANKPAPETTSRATGSRTGRRYIQLAEVAERDGLNHGKCWVCKEIDIETKGALPEWGDELICYVYE